MLKVASRKDPLAPIFICHEEWNLERRLAMMKRHGKRVFGINNYPYSHAILLECNTLLSFLLSTGALVAFFITPQKGSMIFAVIFGAMSLSWIGYYIFCDRKLRVTKKP